MEFFKKNLGAIILVAAIILIVWYFFLRKKKGAESSYDPNLLILPGDNSFAKNTPDCPPNHIFKPCCGCIPLSDLAGGTKVASMQ